MGGISLRVTIFKMKRVNEKWSHLHEWTGYAEGQRTENQREMYLIKAIVDFPDLFRGFKMFPNTQL